ncbi:MAG: sterol desaturase family protein [Rhodospirillales bacterium]|jgi:sterol desaturase/sphingolipid hydroxylase (fatty acid hydroxylase superfamily)|nr:sterol desaturase family protein [Rhodospirillales bacterium]
MENVFDTLLANATALRLGVFFGVLALMMGLEARFPRRARAHSRKSRWPSNLGIVALNSLIARAAFPVAAVGIAALGETNGWGLFNSIGWPFWLTVVLSVVLLDFAIYLQHVLFHAVPALWRLHRMHHADTDIDVTNGARFHPIEIVLSMIIKMAVVAALGAPAIAVLIFEVVLNATAMFNHANLRLPPGLDLFLRLFIVTPDMHRVHHSAEPRETHKNFGFNLPWWDYLMGTYTGQPEAGHIAMTIGLPIFRSPRELRFDRMLSQPFREGGPPPDS